LKITDENNVLVGKYCGWRTGKEVLVGADYAVVAFHTDGDGERRGFRISLTAVQASKYNRDENETRYIIFTLEGVFVSESYLSVYRASMP